MWVQAFISFALSLVVISDMHRWECVEPNVYIGAVCKQDMLLFLASDGQITSSYCQRRIMVTSSIDICAVRFSTRSSSLVTLARPSVSSSLQVTNRSFTYASPYLWNQLPCPFRQPHSVHCPPGSPHPALITSSQSSPSFSPSVTPSTFHSRLKTHLFHKSFPP